VCAAGERKRCTRRVPDESPRDVVSWASSGRNLETVWEVGSGQDFKRPGEWPVSVCKKGCVCVCVECCGYYDWRLLERMDVLAVKRERTARMDCSEMEDQNQWGI
jgi:hypothetical protein